MSPDNRIPPAEPPPSDKPAYTGPEVGFGPAVGAERFWEPQVPTEAGSKGTTMLAAFGREYNVRLEGRAWGSDEARSRRDELPVKIEMIRGRLFLSDKDRLNVLAALLENVGTAVAVRIGDPAVWTAALRTLDDRSDQP